MPLSTVMRIIQANRRYAHQLIAQRDTARRRINAVVRAVMTSQANGQTVTSNAAILAALEADQ